METNLPKAIAAITSLMALNNKRFNYYTEVAGKSRQIELKLLFMKYAIQSQTCNSYLNRWLSAYGTNLLSKKKQSILSKLWYQVKSACTLDIRNFFLNESENLEQEVIKKYNIILASAFFPSEAAADIRKQVDEMELLYQSLKDLRLNQANQLQVA